MFIVFFLSFYVLLNIADLVSRVEHQKRGNATYEHILTVNLQFPELINLVEDGQKDEAKEFIQKKWASLERKIGNIHDCNVLISNLYFPIKLKRENVLCEVEFKKNQDFPYQIKEQVDSHGVILIGESLKQYLFRDNNQSCLCLNNVNYPVSAVLENFGINQQDERVIFLYDRLNRVQRNKLRDQLMDYYVQGYTDGITLTFGSENEIAVKNAYTDFENNFAVAENADCHICHAREQAGELNYWYKLYHSIFSGISICFALLSGIVVSSLWFQKHKKEFIIRLSFGYSKGKIWYLMMIKLGRIAGNALLSSIVIWVLWQIIQKNSISWGMLLIQFGVLMTGAFLVLFITTLYPMKKVLDLDPAEALCRYGG